MSKRPRKTPRGAPAAAAAARPSPQPRGSILSRLDNTLLKLWRELYLVRKVALLEACSYLLLLGVAMPLKYAAGLPQAVRFAGLLHGGLFFILIWGLLEAWLGLRISTRRALTILALSVIPIAPFFFDKRIAHWEQEQRK